MKRNDNNHKQNRITPLSWGKYLKEQQYINTQSIENYFLISKNVKILPPFLYPFRVDASIVIICTQGKLKGTIGLRPFKIEASSLITLPAGDILKFEEISDDLDGIFIVLSQELSDDIFSNVKERIELSLFTYSNPVIKLNKEELDANVSYCKLFENALKDTNNPHLKKLYFIFYCLSTINNMPISPEFLKRSIFPNKKKHF